LSDRLIITLHKDTSAFYHKWLQKAIHHLPVFHIHL